MRKLVKGQTMIGVVKHEGRMFTMYFRIIEVSRSFRNKKKPFRTGCQDNTCELCNFHILLAHEHCPRQET